MGSFESSHGRVLSGFGYSPTRPSRQETKHLDWKTIILGLVMFGCILRIVFQEHRWKKMVSHAEQILEQSRVLNNETRFFVEKVYSQLNKIDFDSVQRNDVWEKNVTSRLAGIEEEMHAEQNRIDGFVQWMEEGVSRQNVSEVVRQGLLKIVDGEDRLEEYIFSRLINETKLDEYKQMYAEYLELRKDVDEIQREHEQLRPYGVYDDRDLWRLPEDVRARIVQSIRAAIVRAEKERVLGLGPRIRSKTCGDECGAEYRPGLIERTKEMFWGTEPSQRGMKMQGQQGNVTVDLEKETMLSGFSIEHDRNKTDCAPRLVEFYRKESSESEYEMMCRMEYNVTGPIIQACLASGKATKIQLRVLSNWGNPRYTWIQRWGIHKDVAGGIAKNKLEW